MADINQGIKYTIEADASKAEKTLQKVCQEAVQNGQQIEKAMAGANAVTSALNGNFVGAIASLGRMTKAVSGLGRVIAGATGWIAIVGGVVSVFNKWRDSVSEARERMEQLKDVKFDQHLDAMKRAQSSLNDEIGKAVSAIDKQLEAETRSLDIIKEKTKAQIELNRQIALEGKTTEEKESINAAANAQLAQTDRESASAKLAAQIAAQGNKTEKLKEMLKGQSGFADSSYADYQASFREEAKIFNEARDKYLRKAIERALNRRENVDISSDEAARERFAAQFRKDFIRRGSNSEAFRSELLNNSDYQAALKRTTSLREIYLGAQGGVDKIKGALSESEAKAKELDQQKEIDKVKTAAAVQAEKNLQAELGKVRLDAGKAQAKELAAAQQGYLVANEQQKSAEQRLSAAQSAVQRAWGWYRDKGSMKAQLDEEKANAEAEKLFQKDFAKLSFSRDWRTKKNLSVDQEATRRVALAREEEAAAQKAVTETAANTARAAEAVEAIQKALEGAENVD